MTPEQIEQERAAFEAWAKSAFIHINLTLVTKKDGTSEYAGKAARHMFEGWLARRKPTMIHLKQLKEAQELYDEAERSAMIAIIILDNALRHKAAAAAHERSTRRVLICTIAANILFFGLWLGIIITGG